MRWKYAASVVLAAFATASVAIRKKRNRTMDDIFETGQIYAGFDLYGADGNKVGKIVAIQTDYVVVEHRDPVTSEYSTLTDCFIPMTAIVSVYDGKGYLNVASDRVTSMGWLAEPGKNDGSSSDDFASASSNPQADSGFAGATESGNGQGFGDWSREQEAISGFAADDPMPADPMYSDEMGAAASEGYGGVDQFSPNVSGEQHGTGMPDSSIDPLAADSWSPPQPAATDDAGGIWTDGFGDVPIWTEPMDTVTQDRIAAEASAESARWNDAETATDARNGSIRLDSDFRGATANGKARNKSAGQRAAKAADGAIARAGKASSGMRGDRSRLKDGRLRPKRSDTKVGSIEEKYNMNFGVRSDTHLSTLLAQRGVESLSELLSQNETATAASGNKTG